MSAFRWLNWIPKSRIFPGAVGGEPTKPSEPSFVGFEGATLGMPPKIEGDFVGLPPTVPPKTEGARGPVELTCARALLNRAGVRIMAIEDGATIGVWSDLDGPEVREALCIVSMDHLPVRYLDAAGIPARYKERLVDGEPVPTSVLAEMERNPAAPWKVRDRMLNQMGWCSKGIPWAEWRATTLNRLFQEQGTSGKPGHITAATVRHGLRKVRGKEL